MRQIRDHQFQNAEYRRTAYLATIAHGTNLQEVLEPAYWAHVAKKLRPLDHIECWWEDGSRYAELLVVKSSGTETSVVALKDVELNQTTKTVDLAKDLAKYEVNYAGPDVGYRIMRKADHVVIHSDVRFNETDAANWLLNYLAQPNRDAPKPPAQPTAKAPAKAAAPKANPPKGPPRPPPGAPIPPPNS